MFGHFKTEKNRERILYLIVFSWRSRCFIYFRIYTHTICWYVCYFAMFYFGRWRSLSRAHPTDVDRTDTDKTSFDRTFVVKAGQSLRFNYALRATSCSSKGYFSVRRPEPDPGVFTFPTRPPAESDRPVDKRRTDTLEPGPVCPCPLATAFLMDERHSRGPTSDRNVGNAWKTKPECTFNIVQTKIS